MYGWSPVMTQGRGSIFMPAKRYHRSDCKAFSLHLDPSESLHQWVERLLGQVRGECYRRVGLHLIGAVLVEGLGGNAATDAQVLISGSALQRRYFKVGGVAYYVDFVPARATMERCLLDMEREQLASVLLMPRQMVERAKGLVSAFPLLERHVSILGLEDFLVSCLITLTVKRRMNPVTVLEKVMERYELLASLSSDGAPMIALQIENPVS